jgi:hypothetical protein
MGAKGEAAMHTLLGGPRSEEGGNGHYVRHIRNPWSTRRFVFVKLLDWFPYWFGPKRTTTVAAGLRASPAGRPILVSEQVRLGQATDTKIAPVRMGRGSTQRPDA